MSEYEWMSDLPDQYLRALYSLVRNRPGNMVAAGEIAEYLDLNINNSTVEEALAGTARHLRGRDLIEALTEDYSLVSITPKGTNAAGGNDTAESATSHSLEGNSGLSPKEQRRRFLEALYKLSNGRISTYVSYSEIAPSLEWDPDNQANEETAIAIAEYLEQSGLVRLEADEGTLYTITGAGIDAVEGDLPSSGFGSPPVTPDEFSNVAAVGEAPVEIQESLQRFRRDYPNPARVAFIMMQFGSTKAHTGITEAIRRGLATLNITGLRADDKRYHDDLFYNVLTYMHGCGLGIAVFERIEAEVTNPNVALEVGYLFAMRKPVCLLKDQTLVTLPADLVSRLYDPFNPQDPAETIPPVIQKWLSDKDLPKA